jgi:hypothetical protein
MRIKIDFDSSSARTCALARGRLEGQVTEDGVLTVMIDETCQTIQVRAKNAQPINVMDA